MRRATAGLCVPCTLLLLILTVASCDGPSEPNSPPPPPSVRIEGTAYLEVGQTNRFTVDTNLNGRPTWSSSNTGVATVDITGMVTAASVGVADICATIRVTTGCARITVLPPPTIPVKFEYRPSPPDNGIYLDPIEGTNFDGTVFAQINIPNVYGGTYYTATWQVKPGQDLKLRIGVVRGGIGFERWLRPDEILLNGTRLQRATPVMPPPAACTQCREGSGAYFGLNQDGSVVP
jgi:hypothetical protein